MKKTPLILSIIALAGVIALAILFIVGNCGSKKAAPAAEEGTAGSSIAYVDFGRILNEYDRANDLQSVFQTKAQSIEQDLNRRSTKFENDYKAFTDKINKGLITRSVAEVQEQQLQKQQANLQNYANQKQQELAEEQQVMTNQIYDAVRTYLELYNADKNYDMILLTQGDLLQFPVAVANPATDVTDEVLAGLNDSYVAEKAAK